MGRVLGIDLGSLRVGLALSDPTRVLATPHSVVRAGDGLIEEIRSLVDTEGVDQIVVGLPLKLDGTDGTAATRAREFASLLSDAVAVPIVLFDERFSTTLALSGMRERGVSSRKGKSSIDKVAAATILASWLESKR